MKHAADVGQAIATSRCDNPRLVAKESWCSKQPRDLYRRSSGLNGTWCVYHTTDCSRSLLNICWWLQSRQNDGLTKFYASPSLPKAYVSGRFAGFNKIDVLWWVQLDVQETLKHPIRIKSLVAEYLLEVSVHKACSCRGIPRLVLWATNLLRWRPQVTWQVVLLVSKC
jgi:hypothetical protein